MHINDPKQIQVGVKIFEVLALGEHSYIDTLVPVSTAHVDDKGDWWFTAIPDSRNDARARDVSCRDANTCSNNYNHHRTFDNHEEAQQYLASCKHAKFTPLTSTQYERRQKPQAAT